MIGDIDLFGIRMRAGARTDAERRREQRRLSEQPRGYAARPGTGPAGETCKTCRHSYRVQSRSRKTFWKCGLVKETHGAKTDIRLKSPSCSRFEPKP